MREHMVGSEHLVGGGPRHPDYDELMEIGAEPAGTTPLARRLPPPGAPYPAHAAPPPGQHHHPGHHHHNGHYPQHDGYYEEQAAPPPQQRRRRIVQEEPTHERLFPIGFILENIAAGAEEDIEVKPQVYFRGERLAIPPTLARYFDIVDIKVGKDSQLAATGPMPGESFSSLAVGVRMELSTAKPGIVITLRVRNVDSQPQDFKAVMYGAVLE
jgi:hypothetical protein